MDRVLVVLDDTDAHRELLAEAAGLAADADAELVLFSWVSPDALEADRNAIESVETVEGTSYGELDSLDFVENFIDEFVGDVLDEPDIEYEVAGAVTETSDLAEAILAAAESHDCDHVFLVGKRRSPTGKVIFGDVTQRVILNFDGYVTVSMD
jgi:nucleotide-binding universal stress UspA family protein